MTMDTVSVVSVLHTYPKSPLNARVNALFWNYDFISRK